MGLGIKELRGLYVSHSPRSIQVSNNLTLASPKSEGLVTSSSFNTSMISLSLDTPFQALVRLDEIGRSCSSTNVSSRCCRDPRSATDSFATPPSSFLNCSTSSDNDSSSVSSPSSITHLSLRSEKGLLTAGRLATSSCRGEMIGNPGK